MKIEDLKEYPNLYKLALKRDNENYIYYDYLKTKTLDHSFNFSSTKEGHWFWFHINRNNFSSAKEIYAEKFGKKKAKKLFKKSEHGQLNLKPYKFINIETGIELRSYLYNVTKEFSESFKSQSELRKENQELKKELDLTKKQLESIEKILDEHDTTKEYLDRKLFSEAIIKHFRQKKVYIFNENGFRKTTKE